MQIWANESLNSLLPSASWRVVFDVAKIKNEIEDIEERMGTPGFWDNEANTTLIDRLQELKHSFERYQTLKEILAQIQEGKTERIAAFERLLRHQQALVWFPGRYDRGAAILTIFAGAGGKDAEDWAGMLFRMYQRFAERKRWKIKILHEHKNEYGGMKNVSFEVDAVYAYGMLRQEHGVHRLVRISPFSPNKLRHTSFALVEVLPVVETPDIEIDDRDIEFDAFRSSGPGGQNVNKVETAVRLTYTPLGITVACQSERSQHQNRVKAKQILQAKLQRIMEEQQAKEVQELHGKKIEAAWGRQIRSYVLHPYHLVKDLRSGVEVKQVESVLDGNLSPFLKHEV